MRGLAEMFNVNYFICSQTNPHIIPALNIKRHLNRTFADMLEQEFKHRCGILVLQRLLGDTVTWCICAGCTLELSLVHVCWLRTLSGL